MNNNRSGINWAVLAGANLEDNNYHSIVQIPEQLYKAIESLVSEDRREELGKIIYDAFRNVW